MGNLIDISGRRFGHLTALGYTHCELSSGRRMPAWRLVCDCGNEVVAMTVNLMKGKHQSCGCRRFDWVSERFPGDTKRPEYRVYRQMLDRCYLETAPNFKWYGGKGVTVCERWRRGTNTLTGFQAFMQDMGDRPKGLTLERDDPFRPYEPGNCRWASWAEQARNRREHHLTPTERGAIRLARGINRRKITPPIKREIIDRLIAGERQIPIARMLGISQAAVSRVKIEAGAN